MSQSPTRYEKSAAAERYFSNWEMLGDMVRRGASFSGRERNRCFLNTTEARFADVSTVAGLDQIDDGRGVAVVDWDHDGDLDLWLSNRTGPRVRMLRNDLPSSRNYVAFELAGTRCNRDAIGARVEVVLSGNRKRIKTLRAGEGFLSQSSKSIHFGLGDESAIEAVKVHWPGEAAPEVFGGIEVNQRHRLVQGQRSAIALQPRPTPTGTISGTSSARWPPNPSDRARTVLTRRLEFPEIAYRDLQTGTETTGKRKGPLLINVWASWCDPCIRELSEFTEYETELRKTGLRIVALSVDDVDTQADATSQSALETIQRIRFPFEVATTDQDQIEKLTDLTHQIFYPRKALSLPCSFLIDANGNLAVFYRGPVDVEQLLHDQDLLTVDRGLIADAAFPFPGRKLLKTQEASPLSVARAYMEGGYLDLARAYVIRHLKQVSEQRDLDRLAEVLSESMQPGVIRSSETKTNAVVSSQQALAAALKAEQVRLQTQGFRLLADIERARKSPSGIGQSLSRLLELDPENDRARGELAVLLFQQGKTSNAEPLMAELRSRATDSLAARLVLGQTLMQRGQPDDAERSFEEAVRTSPDNVEARFNLAMAYQVGNKTAKAVEQYSEILKRQPEHHASLNNLAWLYATDPSPNRNTTEAIGIAKRLCELTNYGSPSYLDTLAAALSESGDFPQAAKVAEMALQLAHGRGETQLAVKLEKRAALYRSGQTITND